MNRSKFIAHLRSCLFYQLHACRSARVFKYFVGGFYNSLLWIFFKMLHVLQISTVAGCELNDVSQQQKRDKPYPHRVSVPVICPRHRCVTP